MWILIRLLLILVMAGARLFKLRKASGEPVTGSKGFSYFMKATKSKNGGVSRTLVIFDTTSPCSFHLVPESRLLRFCKKIGFGSELQTGDAEFDSRFYIASDDPFFLNELRRNSELRGYFLRLSNSGWTHIQCDREQFTLRYDGALPFTPEAEEICAHLKTSIDPLSRRSFARDPFIWRVVLLEVILWAGLGYAIGSFAELSFDQFTYLLEPWPLVWIGVKVSVVIFAVWFAILFLFVRKSSRAPLLISESLLGLALGLLFVGPQAAMDYNRFADQSKPEILETELLRKFSQTRGSGRSRKTYYYFVLQNQLKYGIGPTMRVPFTDYHDFQPPQNARITVREGRLHSRYIESITPGYAIRPQSTFANTLQKAAVSHANLKQARAAATWKAQAPSAASPESFREDHWPNGQLRSREPIVNGKIHGVARYWHANGTAYSEIPWSDGQKNGTYRLYRDDGTLESEISMRAGQPHGWNRWYDEQGNLKQEEVYSDGKHIPLSSEERSRLNN